MAKLTDRDPLYPQQLRCQPFRPRQAFGYVHTWNTAKLVSMHRQVPGFRKRNAALTKTIAILGAMIEGLEPFGGLIGEIARPERMFGERQRVGVEWPRKMM